MDRRGAVYTYAQVYIYILVKSCFMIEIIVYFINAQDLKYCHMALKGKTGHLFSENENHSNAIEFLYV